MIRAKNPLALIHAKVVKVAKSVLPALPVVQHPARTTAPVAAERAGTAVVRVLPSKAVPKNVETLPLAVKRAK